MGFGTINSKLVCLWYYAQDPSWKYSKYITKDKVCKKKIFIFIDDKYEDILILRYERNITISSYINFNIMGNSSYTLNSLILSILGIPVLNNVERGEIYSFIQNISPVA